MKALALTLLLISSQAFAFTGHRCENEDKSELIHLTFDGADNFFVFGKLTTHEGQTGGLLVGTDRLRPRPLDPDHVPLQVAFGSRILTLSFNADSATLTTVTGELEQLICCDEIGVSCRR